MTEPPVASSGESQNRSYRQNWLEQFAWKLPRKWSTMTQTSEQIIADHTEMYPLPCRVPSFHRSADGVVPIGVPSPLTVPLPGFNTRGSSILVFRKHSSCRPSLRTIHFVLTVVSGALVCSSLEGSSVVTHVSDNITPARGDCSRPMLRTCPTQLPVSEASELRASSLLVFCFLNIFHLTLTWSCQRLTLCPKHQKEARV